MFVGGDDLFRKKSGDAFDTTIRVNTPLNNTSLIASSFIVHNTAIYPQSIILSQRIDGIGS